MCQCWVCFACSCFVRVTLVPSTHSTTQLWYTRLARCVTLAVMQLHENHFCASVLQPCTHSHAQFDSHVRLFGSCGYTWTKTEVPETVVNVNMLPDRVAPPDSVTFNDCFRYSFRTQVIECTCSECNCPDSKSTLTWITAPEWVSFFVCLCSFSRLYRRFHRRCFHFGSASVIFKLHFSLFLSMFHYFCVSPLLLPTCWQQSHDLPFEALGAVERRRRPSSRFHLSHYGCRSSVGHVRVGGWNCAPWWVSDIRYRVFFSPCLLCCDSFHLSFCLCQLCDVFFCNSLCLFSFSLALCVWLSSHTNCDFYLACVLCCRRLLGAVLRLSAGHYICVVATKETGYRLYDDYTVRQLELREGQAILDSSYVLFYRKQNLWINWRLYNSLCSCVEIITQIYLFFIRKFNVYSVTEC